MTMMSDPHLCEIMMNSQSTINEVPSPVKHSLATMQDLLLGIDNRRDNGGIDNTRHSG